MRAANVQNFRRLWYWWRGQPVFALQLDPGMAVSTTHLDDACLSRRLGIIFEARYAALCVETTSTSEEFIIDSRSRRTLVSSTAKFAQNKHQRFEDRIKELMRLLFGLGGNSRRRWDRGSSYGAGASVDSNPVFGGQCDIARADLLDQPEGFRPSDVHTQKYILLQPCEAQMDLGPGYAA